MLETLLIEREELDIHEKYFYAEYFKEKIYGVVTLLGVLMSLYFSYTSNNPLKALYIIVGAMGALWLASVFASVIAYNMIFTKNHTLRKEIKKRFLSHTGILIASIPSVLLMLSAKYELISYQFALGTAIIIAIIGLIGSIFQAMKGKTQNIFYSTALFVIQLFTVLLVIILKYGLGK